MSSTKPSKIQVQAGISPAWQPQPPENRSSLPRTIRPLGDGCCNSSSAAAARLDTPPGPPREVSNTSAPLPSRRPRNGGPATVADAAIGERDGLLHLSPAARASLRPHPNPTGATGGINPPHP